ncbi:leucyl/phenylalanyl-tRNA--protein transferase [Aeromicrobium duanguangcaii]|uniref:Leucyl/phenylalanyl-tRNA--protein transferase n=1 Tax=Aeromicrobium duanguangcaii TaxID=2968086 RepID=A0ABY5KFH8_9ACTN|nr:leucyl/phenylalanyl-tRNA--protein transferase [Aeromicrobium duanguangcaii]MCD9154323.1 leucyl/phenylalanyl-tRNA--protein transferase [Aeromicrobium duanguangcaii]MCL3838069.1 leucyl/phenylalanyl-tRNA--protein transferase [Aeromicrobium duanguangcaii]UUI68610.1 leucyl/phenylalanyl-tRNA--protein transferase [Aeromicrobium duanguangcaii]
MKPVPLPPSPWTFDPRDWPRDDCIAYGADLEPATIIEAYRHGAFPMPDRDLLLWWSPLERGVLGPGDLRVSRSLRRSLRHLTITVDTDFEAVVDACADPRRPGSWITSSIRSAYLRLHELGYAHSIETRDEEGGLVGGLYGLALGSLFAGESMFHRRTDASKAALVGLVDRMSTLPEWIIDTQWQTAHLATLGVRVVSRESYLATIETLVDRPAPVWD